MNRSIYVVAYDISDTKIQYQVRKLLQAYAIGKQKSVFECWLTKTEKKSLLANIKLLLSESDVFHLIRPLNPSASMYLGVAKPMQFETFIAF